MSSAMSLGSGGCSWGREAALDGSALVFICEDRFVLEEEEEERGDPES